MLLLNWYFDIKYTIILSFIVKLTIDASQHAEDGSNKISFMNSNFSVHRECPILHARYFFKNVTLPLFCFSLRLTKINKSNHKKFSLMMVPRTDAFSKINFYFSSHWKLQPKSPRCFVVDDSSLYNSLRYPTVMHYEFD